MRVILKSRKHDYIAKVSVFLIAIALIVVIVGCGEVTPPTRYNLTMAVAPAGNGTATDQTGGSPYTAGTGVTINATAAAGYHFVNWSALAGTFANETATQTIFTMPAQNVTVTANFAIGIAIYDWYDLDTIRDNLSGSYSLMNNLDSTTAGYTELASPTANGGKGWQPIGTDDDKFTGTFNGQGYEIRDLFINRPDEDYVGLFGAVEGVIKNVGVVDADVTGGAYYVGGLVGESDGDVSNSHATGNVSGLTEVGGLVGYNDHGTVSNCYATGSVAVGNFSWCSGGLVGDNYDGTVSNSYATGSVTGYDDVGGLVGQNGGTVSDSYAIGSVTGSYYVGGLVGSDYDGTVDNCYSTGSVYGSYYSVGGLMGYTYGGTVSDCYATGDVTGTKSTYDVGGLMGYNYGGTVSNSYAMGSVTGYDYVGGLVGENDGTVSDSYSTGYVTGSYDVGGLVGENWDTVSDSFWDTETSGQATSAGGTGKTTVQMKDIDTFTGAEWDIIAVDHTYDRNTGYVWNIVDDVTYPFLNWQPV